MIVIGELTFDDHAVSLVHRFINQFCPVGQVLYMGTHQGFGKGITRACHVGFWFAEARGDEVDFGDHKINVSHLVKWGKLIFKAIHKEIWVDVGATKRLSVLPDEVWYMDSNYIRVMQKVKRQKKK